MCSTINRYGVTTSEFVVSSLPIVGLFMNVVNISEIFLGCCYRPPICKELDKFIVKENNLQTKRDELSCTSKKIIAEIQLYHKSYAERPEISKIKSKITSENIDLLEVRIKENEVLIQEQDMILAKYTENSDSVKKSLEIINDDHESNSENFRRKLRIYETSQQTYALAGVISGFLTLVCSISLIALKVFVGQIIRLVSIQIPIVFLLINISVIYFNRNK
jgi:hypothetical protein